MKIKTKLRMGIGLLFLMILMFSAVGIKNINSLKNDGANILADNYNSLEYCENMIAVLDLLQQKEDGLSAFEKNLDLQKKNITESGEGEATDQISNMLNPLRNNTLDVNLHIPIRKNISRIMKLNMAAIKHKSDIAKKTAETANHWIVIASTLCFLLGMTLFVNLPGDIASKSVPGPSDLQRT